MVADNASTPQHSFGTRILAALSYFAVPMHALQVALLGFFGTVWNIGFIGYLVGGPAFAIGYLIFLVALGLVVQAAISILVFQKPDALDDIRKMQFWKWRMIKDL